MAAAGRDGAVQGIDADLSAAVVFVDQVIEVQDAAEESLHGRVAPIAVDHTGELHRVYQVEASTEVLVGLVGADQSDAVHGEAHLGVDFEDVGGDFGGRLR